jgi:hypothetical protein
LVKFLGFFGKKKARLWPMVFPPEKSGAEPREFPQPLCAEWSDAQRGGFTAGMVLLAGILDMEPMMVSK